MSDDTVTKTPLDSVRLSAGSAGSGMSSGQGSPLQLEHCTAMTLPSASLLMSELLIHQRDAEQQQQQPQQPHPMTIIGRAADTVTRCASPGLLTDITSLLSSYQNF